MTSEMTMITSRYNDDDVNDDDDKSSNDDDGWFLVQIVKWEKIVEWVLHRH